MSFKATNFGTNRKLMYDFLLVINTNLPPILHRFRDIAVDGSEIYGKPFSHLIHNCRYLYLNTDICILIQISI